MCDTIVEDRYANEKWRPVVGWPHEVSDLGRVRGPSGLLTGTDIDGYVRVHLHVRGEDHEAVRGVHSLVLEAFVGPRPDGMQCCHGNGQRGDNRLSNLRWGTSLENKADSTQHGTAVYPRGEANGRALLTRDDVIAIRMLPLPQSALAAKFGVGESQISRIRRYQEWKTIPPMGQAHEVMLIHQEEIPR